jgi:hypothetical protein
MHKDSGSEELMIALDFQVINRQCWTRFDADNSSNASCRPENRTGRE